MSQRADPNVISATEHQTIRLYALNLEGAELAAFLDESAKENGAQGPLKEALGATELDGKHIETFSDKDIAALGLAAYLEDGHGIDGSDLDEDALNALTGHFLLVHAPAFRGIAQRLKPSPPLSLIGAYRIAPMAPPIDMAPADMAPLDIAPPQTPPPQHSPNDGKIVVGILAALLIIVIGLLLGLGGS